jgi:hypothetical protein
MRKTQKQKLSVDGRYLFAVCDDLERGFFLNGNVAFLQPFLIDLVIVYPTVKKFSIYLRNFLKKPNWLLENKANFNFERQLILTTNVQNVVLEHLDNILNDNKIRFERFLLFQQIFFITYILCNNFFKVKRPNRLHQQKAFLKH